MAAYSIKELHHLLVDKKITPSQIVKDAFTNLDKYQVLNATVTELKTEATALAAKLDHLVVPKNNYLFALPYFAKDNFATKEIKTTASSKILENFIPNYESTVTNILKENNSILLGKAALDELGMGGHGLYALTGDVLNPWDLSRITGGSSSGSAALVAAGVVPFALGTDTGDSVRKPAGYCGVVGFKPTYGLISRYGVFPYAPSLDTVGYFTRDVEDSAIVFDYLAQEDHKDATSLKSKEQGYFKNLSSEKIKEQKFAYLKNAHAILPDEIRIHFDHLYDELTARGISITAIDFPEDLLKALMPVYMVISFAEAVSSHSMLDGINYGTRVDGDTYQEVMMNSRTNGFGHVVKRRYVIGSYTLTKNNQTLLFLKAKRVRRLIVNALTTVFAKYDFLLLPAASTIAPKITTIKDQILTEAELENYVDDLLVLGNLMGNPSLTVPLAFVDKIPIGINVNAAPFADQKVFNASLLIEEIVGIKNKVAPERGNNHD
ncbi:amidase family protein [Spiroplasma endosymbiont of Megaselia nigra]|uniref:amidase family protein n=1 Tax=Spiroplasma endosymbiont of Megaselia nigra TaxID=2478537 RepID=UPI000F8782E0|nr:amidase family protein [Spiroplasma endosymbiont of Megaselia nigra]RUO86581.1 Asp-tRNA(Asn)/Glu-tRNA(Gln) amidotransferase subunit GatA [Spiroplasma endosymbiont of Megaselia nigra]